MPDNFKVDHNEYLSHCDPKDVISFSSENLTSINKLKTVVHGAFANAGITSISNYIHQNLNLQYGSTWFREGEECEILRASSSGWQKGKIKIKVTLEFIPDEPEEINSPLDDVRQELNQSISEL